MSRFVALLLAAVLVACAPPTRASDADFEELADQFVTDLPSFSPAAATWIGDHSADAELDQVDAAARTWLAGAYRGYGDAIAAIDRESLSRAQYWTGEFFESGVPRPL